MSVMITTIVVLYVVVGIIVMLMGTGMAYKMGYENGKYEEQMFTLSVIINTTREERSGEIGKYENMLLEKLRKEHK